MHPSEDQLLGYAIGTLGAEERQEIETHLATCALCREQQAEMTKDIEQLAGVRVDAAREYPPLPVRERMVLPQWAKLAAVLVLGFVGGALAAEWWTPETVVIIPMPQIERSQATPPSPTVPEDALQTRPM
jgi:anti-sigma factor RsiW